jgi:hypothetical protein
MSGVRQSMPPSLAMAATGLLFLITSGGLLTELGSSQEAQTPFNTLARLDVRTLRSSSCGDAPYGDSDSRSNSNHKEVYPSEVLLSPSILVGTI